MNGLDGACVYEFAKYITAVEDVYFYATTYSFVNDEEAGHLLIYENPLRMLSFVWGEYLENRFDGITIILERFIKNSINGYCDEAEFPFEEGDYPGFDDDYSKY